MLLTIEYTLSLSDLAVILLTILASALGFVIKRQKNKIDTINQQLSEKKYELYNEVISIFFDIMKEEKVKKQKTKDLGTRIIDIKQDLIIYAPDKILYKFIEWTRYTNNNETGDLRHFPIYLELLALIRKDMGHPKTSFSENDFWKLIMTTDTEIEEMKGRILNYEPEDKKPT